VWRKSGDEVDIIIARTISMQSVIEDKQRRADWQRIGQSADVDRLSRQLSKRTFDQTVRSAKCQQEIHAPQQSSAIRRTRTGWYLYGPLNLMVV
jgi:hypothetical protein